MRRQYAADLRALILRHAATLEAFAQAVDPGKAEKSAVGLVSKILHGTRPLPGEWLTWADRCLWPTEAKEEFRFLCVLLMLPDAGTSLVYRLRAKLQTSESSFNRRLLFLESQLTSLDAENSRLNGENSGLKSRVSEFESIPDHSRGSSKG